MKMNFVISNNNRSDELENSIKMAQVADESGFHAFLMTDHYMCGEDSPLGNSSLETWITLSHIASKTDTIKVGTLVTPIPFRPPAMLAKMLSTIDILSNGRVILGVGAGWSQPEFEGYSEWSDAKTRVAKTEEGIKLILELWEKPKVDFHGTYYHAKGAVLDPKPVQKPHPPLLFGGASRGGIKMLKMAGRYGDICYVPHQVDKLVDGGFERAVAIVKEAAKEAGREGKVKFGWNGIGGPPIESSPQDPVKKIQEASQNGAEYFLVNFPKDGSRFDKIKAFGRDVIPSFT